jgi:hypothetical protein
MASEEEASCSLEQLLCTSDDVALLHGLENLKKLPPFDPGHGSPKSIPGKKFTEGVIGLRNARGKTPSLAIACGTNTVRYIKLDKFVALVENLDDPDSATVMLENFSDADTNRSGRGQVLARINPDHSAITVVQGLTGRIIRNISDIALYDVYYLDRRSLTAFYLAAKEHLAMADVLDEMIASYDGWRAFDIPLDPLNPYAASVFEDN